MPWKGLLVMSKVEVVNANGDRQFIPQHWVGSRLGEGFEVVVRTKADEDSLEGKTVEELKDFAEQHTIDLTGAKKKPEILAVILGHLETVEDPDAGGDPAGDGEQ